ncbi:hypothetical protein D3C85_1149240 [compost metagenome]
MALACAVPFRVTCNVARICGTISAAPAPCNTRAPSNCSTLPAIPHSSDARPNAATPHINRRRRPRLSPSLLPSARHTAKATPYRATISSSSVAEACKEWVIESSATLVIEVSISGSIWPVSSNIRPARPGETTDVFMVTPLRHSADGRSITDIKNGYQFLLILVLALPCRGPYDADDRTHFLITGRQPQAARGLFTCASRKPRPAASRPTAQWSPSHARFTPRRGGDAG